MASVFPTPVGFVEDDLRGLVEPGSVVVSTPLTFDTDLVADGEILRVAVGESALFVRGFADHVVIVADGLVVQSAVRLRGTRGVVLAVLGDFLVDAGAAIDVSDGGAGAGRGCEGEDGGDGDDGGGIVWTTLLGVAGSFVGGTLGNLLLRRNAFDLGSAGFVGSVIGAIVLLAIYGMVYGRRRATV
jgi:uncharacterized membrane protein YeaQ/YmgE (transglycosylase-associated protein family)